MLNILFEEVYTLDETSDFFNRHTDEKNMESERISNIRRMLKVLNHLLIFLFFGGWREGLDTFNVILAHALHFDITDLR